MPKFEDWLMEQNICDSFALKTSCPTLRWTRKSFAANAAEFLWERTAVSESLLEEDGDMKGAQKKHAKAQLGVHVSIHVFCHLFGGSCKL